ncbi:hypothetical protein Hdeb2414_s0008g00298531 [Helianthus debilis subsp. tardiflorus]
MSLSMAELTIRPKHVSMQGCILGLFRRYQIYDSTLYTVQALHAQIFATG